MENIITFAIFIIAAVGIILAMVVMVHILSPSTEEELTQENIDERIDYAIAALSAMDLQIAVEAPAAAIISRSAFLIADAMITARKK